MKSDAEVILTAYRALGTDCLERFVGMFALAIYDGHSDGIFVARDRTGEKPLFYLYGGRRFSFTSELKALLMDPAIPRPMEPEAVEWFLTTATHPIRQHATVALGGDGGDESSAAKGFSVSLADWFKGDSGGFVEKTLFAAPPELFDLATVEIRNQKKGYSNVHRLFGLTMLELWRREYDIAIPS